ncbi:MAG TPA: glycogen synthase GlgA [Xanthomonadales bacterium]|nr:glycogen synthase GlgA [Xanthomonadales bacterium]
MAAKPLKIFLTASEFAPLAKTGGLADVASALSENLDGQGHDIRVLLPFYSSIDTSELDIQPVEFMQDLVMQCGPHQIRWSVDTAQLKDKALKIYLLRCPALFNREGIYTSGADEHLRFIMLTRASIEMCQQMGFAPDIFHCHDWHTALAPLYLKTYYAWDKLFENTRSVLTIHNIGYQGIFNSDILPDTGMADSADAFHQEDLGLGRISFLKTGVLYADLITTVSPTYAQEILRPEYGMGLQDLLKQRPESLVGILNGVDYGEWNPETDKLIPYNYTSAKMAGKKKNKLALMKELELDSSDDMPLVGMVTRLTYQKGIELVQKVVPNLLQERRFALAVLGSGEPRYEHFFTWLQNNLRDRVCFYRGFNNKLAHQIEAGSDIFLMPSRFEPCGLNQMYSLKYGTVPVVRNTGGLADSVQLFNPATGEGTGLVFDDFNAQAFGWGLNTALDLYTQKKSWNKLRRNGMAMDYSWDRQGEIYVDTFRKLIARR